MSDAVKEDKNDDSVRDIFLITVRNIWCLRLTKGLMMVLQLLQMKVILSTHISDGVGLSGVKNGLKNLFDGTNTRTWIHGFITLEMRKQHVIKKYFIGELESSLENDSGGEDIPIIL